MNHPELRELCASQLLAAASRASQMSAFIGFDGFVDEILHVVDKRESTEKYARLRTMNQFAERLADAAGQSANVELVRQLVKLGGNGPIMANALAVLGLKVTYLGILGYPALHPVFTDFAKRAEVHSIAEPGFTEALEFEDGKLMLGKHESLKEVTWENIKTRFGRDRFAALMGGSDLVAFVNWTMLTAMSDIWSSVLREIGPGLTGPRRRFFIDLADPEKRTRADILRALELIARFQPHLDVILGLNEKEGFAIADALGLPTANRSPAGVLAACQATRDRLKLDTVVIHPTTYAVACGPDGCVAVDGPFTPQPRITTGAGDHFNSGFCLGKLLGFPTSHCLLIGVVASGFYVRSGESPTIPALAKLLRNWPG